MAPASGFTVLWQSVGSYGTDQSVRSIQGRRYRWNGTPIGDQLQTNTFTTSGQERPSLSRDVAVWQSAASAGSDSSWYSIQGRFLPPAAIDGIQGWWRGDWDATDSSGWDNHGTMQGGVGFASGAMGRAFALDGSDGFIVVADDPTLDVDEGDFSITYWVRTLGSWPIVVDKRAVAPGPGWAAYLQEGCPGLLMRDATGTSKFTSTAFVSSGGFHFVAITVERDSPTGGTIYVDGQAALGFDPTVRPGSLANDEHVIIGRETDSMGGEGHLHGLIDDVRIYGRALSRAEVGYLAGTMGDVLFADDFETGNVLSWTETVP
jgi:hypothetical protein